MEGTTRLTERVGRAALAIVLAVGLMLPAAALTARPGQAWARSGASVTFTHITGNANTTYDAYKVFTADFVETSTSGVFENNAYNIHWANDSVKAAVVSALVAWDNTSASNDTYLEYLISRGALPANATAQTAGYTEAINDPVNAADYIASRINDTTNGSPVDAYTPTEGDNKLPGRTAASFAQTLANALIAGTGVSAEASSCWSSNVFTGDSGYYLFVTHPWNATSSNAEAGTAPIWFPVGGASTTITEKAAIPTVAQDVLDNQNALNTTGTMWTKNADGYPGLDLDYRIVGKLPANIGTFSHYYVSLNAVLAANQIQFKQDVGTSSTDSFGAEDILMVLYSNANDVATVGTSVKAGMDQTAVNSAMSDAGASGTATVLAPDSTNSVFTQTGTSAAGTLKAVTPDLVAGSDRPTNAACVVVYYKAHLMEGSTIGSTGNMTTVTMEYTADPMNAATFATATKATATAATQVKTYTYQIDLYKYAKDTGVSQMTSASHATFKIKHDSMNKFLNENGGLVEEANAHAFSTENTAQFPRVDGGSSYTIIEVDPPSGYGPQVVDATASITSTLDPAASTVPSTVTMVVGGGEANDAVPKLRTQLGKIENDTHVGNSYYNSTNGTLDMMTVDPKLITMPLTGLPGYVGVAIAGVLLVLVGFGGIFLLRRGRAKREGL